MVLNQQDYSDSVRLEECFDGIINTGTMTACVSIILLCNNANYGIHCGGGISKDWKEKIINLFKAKNVNCYRMIAIFGITYQDPGELDYLEYKIEYIADIKKGIGAEQLEIYSASKFEYEILTGRITGENCKSWLQNHWA